MCKLISGVLASLCFSRDLDNLFVSKTNLSNGVKSSFTYSTSFLVKQKGKRTVSLKSRSNRRKSKRKSRLSKAN